MKDFIEKLIDFDGNHYELAVVASKRASYLVNKNIIPDFSEKPAVVAIYQILNSELEVIDTSKSAELEEEL
ncbi:MAG: DNA-directed RNA polymerase subunit omega [Brevinematia bacterium]|jgi:DNA-directed RNA polymerase subunit K/omega